MEYLIEILKPIIGLISTMLGSLLVYNVIDVRKKRKIETYWKIEQEYKSKEQYNARTNLFKIAEDIAEYRQKSNSKEQIDIEKSVRDYYNKKWHHGPDESLRDVARSARLRIKFINQIGVLLKKKMIDKDLVFSLMGLGFKIDYPIIDFMLKCHREYHNAPNLYPHVASLLVSYEQWESTTPLID